MHIIPAIDIIDGKCVRLTHGDFSRQKIYNADPVAVAKQFEDAGIKRLHLVDLDGAKAGCIKNIRVLENISAVTDLKTDFGGGIKTETDITAVFSAGAFMATIGSLAVTDPMLTEQWLKKYGSEKIFIGADVYEEKIKISGWLEDGNIDIFNFLKNVIAGGATEFFCTDIKKDGAMQGTSVELYRKIISTFPGIRLTASGGVTTVDDLELLKEAGCCGAIIGKAIYEETISLAQLSKF